ncbi:MAG: hypothetical protein H6R14_1002 [Proteobacteria bacterium]|nr:hypothetical protein [Pseudomonadota bacterium]
MSTSSKVRHAQLVALAVFVVPWLLDKPSLGSLILASVLAGFVFGLAWLTKKAPGLSKVIGYLFIAAPFIAWMAGVFDRSRYHGDGTWAYAPMVLFLFLGLASFGLGVLLIKVANDDSEYTEEEQLELLRKTVTGDKSE